MISQIIEALFCRFSCIDFPEMINHMKMKIGRRLKQTS